MKILLVLAMTILTQAQIMKVEVQGGDKAMKMGVQVLNKNNIYTRKSAYNKVSYTRYMQLKSNCINFNIIDITTSKQGNLMFFIDCLD